MLHTKFYIFIIFLISSYSLEAALKCNHCNHCDQWIAKLVSVTGRVEKQHRNQSKWQPVSQFEFFCQGDKIRTLKHSRVKLKFIQEPATIMELQENSALTFPKTEKDAILPFNSPEDGAQLLAKAINALMLVFHL